MKIKLPQWRILDFLSDGQLHSRQEIIAGLGYSQKSTTVNTSLNGRKWDSSSGPAYLGLIDMGLVEKLEVLKDGGEGNEDGVAESVYRVTKEGKLLLANRTSLPPVRDRKSCTNLRYKGDVDVQEKQG